MEISLCMIVKDEEKYLDACLSSVCDLVDEINIVDTGSTDNTIEIAKKYTDRLFSFEWINDFAAARNFSFSKATKDYILWLDADDVVTEENRRKFKLLKEELSIKSYDMVFMKYDYYFDEKHQAMHSHVRERLVKRIDGYHWEGKIHEHLKLTEKDSEGLMSDVAITHTRDDLNSSAERNLSILKEQIESGNADLREKYYYAHHLYSLGRYDESLELYNEFLELLGDDYYECTEGILTMHDIYMKRGDYANALNVLLDNEKNCDDMSEFYCALGNYFLKAENNAQVATKHFKRALQCEGMMKNHDIPAYKYDLYYYMIPLQSLGQCQVMMNRFDEALDYYQKARTYNRKDPVLKDLVKKLETLVSKISA
jgi:glycosyltransferase involved in cell wall biosynthesis